MEAKRKQMIRQRLPGPLVLQGLIALGVFLFALTPAAGGTALYLPIGAGSSAGTLAWSRDHGADLLASGPYSGAFFLHVPARNLTGAALANGALLISVPEFLCGTPVPERMVQPS